MQPVERQPPKLRGCVPLGPFRPFLMSFSSFSKPSQHTLSSAQRGPRTRARQARGFAHNSSVMRCIIVPGFLPFFLPLLAFSAENAGPPVLEGIVNVTEPNSPPLKRAVLRIG